MTDRELVALMSAVIAAGVRSDGCGIHCGECVEVARTLLNAVELGPTNVQPIPPSPGPNASLQEKAEWRDAIGR